VRRALLALVLLLPGCSAFAQELPVEPWRTAAVQPMDMLAAPEIRDATCRQAVRVTAAGARVRVRLSNARSPRSLSLSAVTVGRRASGAAAQPRSLRPLTVRGATAFTIGAGEEVDSDALLLPVAAGDELLVSVAVAGGARLTAHRFGAATGWCSRTGTGDLTGAEAAAGFVEAGREGLLVEQVEVESRTGPRAVVATGDSLTDAPLAPDAGPRWTDVLAERAPGTPVVNAAIAGNRVVLGNGYGAPLVERFDHDVLERSGAGTLVLLAGTNDLSMGIAAPRLVRELEGLVARARTAGLRVVLVTVPPAKKRSVQAVSARRAVNRWIRTTDVADAVVDADAVLRNPSGAEGLAPAYDVGDGLHLSPAGHVALGEAVARVLG
jgi:lysophospholipase L1-like esterase